MPVILLIDDNPQDRDFYTQRLGISLSDVQIVHAATGQEGLTYCEHHLVDCVVLEIALPDVSGLEVLAKLVPRSWHPDIPIIVLTGIANRFLWDAALKNGAQAALYKPMTSGDMLDKAVLKAMSMVPRGSKAHERIVSAAIPSFEVGHDNHRYGDTKPHLATLTQHS